MQGKICFSSMRGKALNVTWWVMTSNILYEQSDEVMVFEAVIDLMRYVVIHGGNALS